MRRLAWQTRLDSRFGPPSRTVGTWRSSSERQGSLDAIVTQNIDGLHQLAGSDPERVIEIHGTAHETVCWSCGHRTSTPEVLEPSRAGEEDPRCLELAAAGSGGPCGGILKSATISFGQNLDPEVLARSEEAALSADLLLAVGSTLSVYPAAGLVLAKRAGASVVIVNGAPTDLDRLATHVLRGAIGELLPAIVPRTTRDGPPRDHRRRSCRGRGGRDRGPPRCRGDPRRAGGRRRCGEPLGLHPVESDDRDRRRDDVVRAVA